MKTHVVPPDQGAIWAGIGVQRKRLVWRPRFSVSEAMTEELTPLATVKPAKPGGVNQLMIDLGPIAVYVVAFNILQRIEATKDNAVYIATGIFMVATIAAIVWCKLKQGRIPPVLVVTGFIVTAFGGLTLLMHDPTYIQIKPTFTYLFYVSAILISLAIKQNVWKLLFGHAFNLPDRIWVILALRWSAFFLFQAVLNEVIRNTQTFEFWLNSRPFIVFPLTLVFAAINTPIVLKHHQDPEEEAAPPAAGA
jgi:intracellular septation protein